MKFVQFAVPTENDKIGPKRLGALLAGDSGEDFVVDISGVDSSIPNDMVSFLNAGSEKIKKAKRVVAEGRSVLELSKVKLLPPVTQPDKVVCVGLNYRDHCEEQKVPLPSEPMFFSKWSSCITGPYDDIPFPSITKNLDWEVEVALVIGRKARGIRPTSAMDYVFGMCAAQDITARDWQGKGPRSCNGGQWLIAKATDSSCPLGPALVQLSSIPDAKSMVLRCSVNGELKQDGNTHNMIHSFEEIVAFLSQ
ncbi:hypothetical protein J437_LFUL007192 [Ladona fulva]|uniref:Fumarylacetoacetase-like C-terminal domain-containing protein n=1 Tax=Ladona fulva TaxID=123851 RepID=A0A8K0K3Z7_LADFU|nr:hypothetical protein J437_LFUL007192 [Ladona fulva]